MMHAFRSLKMRADRHSGLLLIAGLGAIFVQNRRAWRQDRALLAKIRAERAVMPVLKHTPNVSVLVAAWNEHDQIDAHLRSFLELTYPAIELILCAGGADDTFARAQRYANDRITVLEQRVGEGKQRALARCYERATGEIIYLTDADCRYDNAALLRLLAPIINDGEQAATGGSRPLDDQRDKVLPRYVWSADVVASSRSGMYSEGLLGRNAAVTRAALDRIGGLAWEARTGTDYHLARKLIAQGISIRYVGASVVATAYPETVWSYWQKQSRWLRNLLLYGPHYGAASDVRATRRTIATGLGMLLAPLTALVLGRTVFAGWFLPVAYAVAAKLRYAVFTARLHHISVQRPYLLSLAPLTLLDFAIWASPLLDLFNSKRRERW